MTGTTRLLACLSTLAVVAALDLPAQRPSDVSIDPGAELIRSILHDGRHVPQRWPLLSDVGDALQALYDGGAAPLWSADGQPTPSARALIRQLGLIDARGLVPADHDAVRLETLAALPTLAPAARAEFDVMLTTAAVRALRALRFGRVSAAAAHAQLDFAREEYDVAAAVREMTTSGNPSLMLDRAEPPFLHYQLLKAAMARYRQLGRDTTLTQIPISPPLRADAIDGGVPALRRLLAALGDIPASARIAAAGADSLRFDSLLVAGVIRFQQRKGFVADGIIGKATLAQLRRPFEARVAQMALTLERWRWLPHTLGDPSPVIVNVPAFRLHAFTTNSDREADLLSMDVVVGDAFQHRTPVFSGALRYLVFSPYWDVPPSITRNEILPHARADAGYLERGDYEVVSNAGTVLGTSRAAVNAVAAGRARIRQKPGPTNALGRVKFIFPNAYNVYLHDTPSQSVFARARRDASHGCIRVAQPEALARLLLRDQVGWDSTAVATALTRTTPLQVNLTRRVPVHIVYATAVAREDGTLLFFEDIYGHDRRLATLLTKGFPYPGGGR